MNRISFSTILIFMCNVAYGSDLQDIRTEQAYLSSGKLAVASEGNIEPRSIGSYALRIYTAATPEFPFDDFIVGTVNSRDGSIEKVITHDFDRDGLDEIIVIMRSVGTGSYLSADAFKYEKGSLSLLSVVQGLKKDADPIQALELAIKNSN